MSSNIPALVSALLGAALVVTAGEPVALAAQVPSKGDTANPPEGAPPAPTAEVAVPFRSGETAPSPTGVSIWGMVPWGGLGVGARLMIPLSIGPLLHNGSVRDSFALEGGADLLHFSSDAFGSGFSYDILLPVAGLMWNVWLSPRFALYPKIELGYMFAWVTGYPGPVTPSYSGLFADGAGGVLYKMGSGITLRAELGIAGLKLGAGWLF